MRRILVAVMVVLATMIPAAPALARDHPFDVGTKLVDWGTITSDGYSGSVSGAISVTNTSNEPVALHVAITISKPNDWAQDFDPFIVEDLGVPPNWDSCEILAPGATCLIYLTFQTDRPGTFAGTLWINDTYRVKLRAEAV
jgi:hypothetical protein